MNIFFDLDFKEKGFYDNCTPEEKIILNTIWDYVYDRTVILFDELKKNKMPQHFPWV